MRRDFFVELEDKCWPECCGLRYNFPSRRQGRRLSGTSTLTPRFKSLRKGCNNVGFQTTGVWRSCEETTFSPQMSTLTSLDPKLLCEPLQSQVYISHFPSLHLLQFRLAFSSWESCVELCSAVHEALLQHNLGKVISFPVSPAHSIFNLNLRWDN